MDIKKKRNMGLFGHGGCGKTSLADRIAYMIGANNRVGSPDNGTSIFDYDEEEISRKITISLALASGSFKGYDITVVDTPGYLDFVGDTLSGVKACDIGVILVDASSGVEVGTEKVYSYLKEDNKPIIIFVNKLNKEHTDFFSVYEQIHSVFGISVFPMVLPVKDGEKLKGVVDILKGKSYIYSGDKREEGSIPDDLKARYEEYKEKILDAVAEFDEKLMEKFIEGEEISPEELRNGIKEGLKAGKVIPVLGGDGVAGIGVEELLDFIIEFAPSPDELTVKGRKGDEEVEITPGEGEPLAYIFKTISEPHVGEINLAKIIKGEIRSGMTIKNTTKNKDERITQILTIRGKERKEVDSAHAGDIVGFVKLKDTDTGDTLSTEGIVIEPIKFPEPSISIAIVPKSKSDEQRVSAGLSKLHKEDPTFSYHYDPEIKQELVSGLGELHIDVLLARLKKKFEVDVDTERPKIKYRETITKKAEAQGKYKKQTGGRGQYGDVWLRIEPLPRGADFEFVDAIVGGVIPAKFIPSVEKGVREAMAQGMVAGYPMVDIKATVYDGSHHPVDSSDIAFKIAGGLAFKNAAEKANPVLLEPIMEVEIVVPEEFMGDVIGDLNSRRARIQGMEAEGKYQRIKALVPESEMYKYSNTLRSITQGRGVFTMKFSHYEEVPREIADKIIEEAKRQKEE